MNVQFVINQVGLLMIVLSGVMLAVTGWAIGEWLFFDRLPRGSLALMLSAAAGLVIGGTAYLGTRSHARDKFGRREAMVLVSASWLVGAALAALPYLLWAHLETAPGDHPFRHYIDCYFEAMSGLTTTGASILTEIEQVPRTLLLWRGLTQWLGGLGIVVLFVAVLPSLGVGARKLFSFEMTGPSPGGVRPRIRETAKVLWIIYCVFTIVAILLLRLCGMSWFEAFSNGFATLAIGGFSPHSASIGGYQSTAIHFVIMFFIVVAGVNFAVYYQIVTGGARHALRDTQTRVYLGMLAIVFGIVVATLLISGQPIETTDGRLVERPAEIVEHGLFNAASLSTTTGFASADFDGWPFLAKAVLLAAMIIGGSAGSTAGGLKAIRVWIAIKVIVSELERAFHPHVIRPTRAGRTVIDQDLKQAVLAYVLGILLLCATASVVIMMLEYGQPEATYETTATAAVATVFNVGPGFAGVGPTANYAWMSPPTKVFLTLLMLLGRLEVFAILALFMPRFWRTD